jgi:hypothetical protein
VIENEEYEGLDPDVSDTAHRELEASTERAITAAQGVQRTAQVVTLLRAAVGEAKVLHQENGYVPRLRAIFRGDAA